jgi:hypothetical protein
MGELATRIAQAEGWPSLANDEIEAAAGADARPLALFFMGLGANRRETDDVAVVLRELARSGAVRPAVIGAGEGRARAALSVVAAPSLAILGPGGRRVVPLIADWSDYHDAIDAARGTQPEGGTQP